MAAEPHVPPDGLSVTVDADGVLRIGWQEPDWFGPAQSIPLDGVSTAIDVVDEGIVVSLTAERDLSGIATGDLVQPSVGWRFDPEARADGGVAEGARAFGFQYTEFALPTHSDASLGGCWLLPSRPNIVEPLGLIAPDGRTLLLAPLDGFHE